MSIKEFLNQTNNNVTDNDDLCCAVCKKIINYNSEQYNCSTSDALDENPAVLCSNKCRLEFFKNPEKYIAVSHKTCKCTKCGIKTAYPNWMNISEDEIIFCSYQCEVIFNYKKTIEKFRADMNCTNCGLFGSTLEHNTCLQTPDDCGVPARFWVK